MSMSVDGEDTELRDLVAETLEKSGTLGKIKANLRAAVFLTLEEQEGLQNKPPLVNQDLRSFLNTNEGHLVAGLIKEFLEFYDLDFTLSVFEPESGFKDAYPGREKLAKELKIDGQNKPLLAELLQQFNKRTTSPRSPTLVLDDLKPKPKDDLEKSTSSQKEKSRSSSSEPQASSARGSKIPQRVRDDKSSKSDNGNISDDDDSFFDKIINSKSSDGGKDKKGKHKKRSSKHSFGNDNREPDIFDQFESSLISDKDEPKSDNNGSSPDLSLEDLNDDEHDDTAPPNIYQDRLFNKQESYKSILPTTAAGDDDKSRSEKSNSREKSLKSPDAKDLAEIDDKIRKLGYEVPTDDHDGGEGDFNYDDDYEDDFQPSSHISDNGSVSIPEEIDEQISIGSLNSSSNRFDDLLTTDRTMSQSSMTGFDYGEDIVDF